ncbi:MAG: VCBS repeat-containing protein [Candidatus Binatia bacterium]
MIPVTVATARRTAAIILGALALAPAARPGGLPAAVPAAALVRGQHRRRRRAPGDGAGRPQRRPAAGPGGHPADRRTRLGARLNDGAGAFGAPTDFDLGGVTPTSVAVADVELAHRRGTQKAAPDGKPDLLVGGDAGRRVIVPGHGDGTFPSGENQLVERDETSDIVGPSRWAASTPIPAPTSPCSTPTACWCCATPPASWRRAAAASSSPSATTVEIVGGDFNGDGHADLAVLDRADQRVWPLLGGGDGSFTSGSPVNVSGEASGAEAVDMAVARVDDDNLDDLVIANRNELLQFIAVTLIGTARGTFAAWPSSSTSTPPPSRWAISTTATTTPPTWSSATPAAPAAASRSTSARAAATSPIPSFRSAPTPGAGEPAAVGRPQRRRDRRPARGARRRRQRPHAAQRHAALLRRRLQRRQRRCRRRNTRGIGILLGERDARDCIAVDLNGDLQVTVGELVAWATAPSWAARRPEHHGSHRGLAGLCAPRW